MYEQTMQLGLKAVLARHRSKDAGGSGACSRAPAPLCMGMGSGKVVNFVSHSLLANHPRPLRMIHNEAGS